MQQQPSSLTEHQLKLLQWILIVHYNIYLSWLSKLSQKKCWCSEWRTNNNTITGRYCHHLCLWLLLPDQHLILPGSLRYQKRFAGVVNGKQTSNNNTIQDRYCHHLQVWLFVPDQHLILPGLSKLSKRTSCSQWKTNQQQQHYQGPLLLLLPSYTGLPFFAGAAPYIARTL